MGKVTLIGAGPGDVSLITVKGLEKIKTCDVIIYDRLISEELLSYAKPEATIVYVGKEAGAHSITQKEINRILVEYGKRNWEVVRLKGGDPFVFGRGGEEIEALMAHGIPFEVIPGITSAVAVPELAGIPVTHRGISRSFHVITGHTKDGGELPKEQYQALAQSEGTLVFLMGLRNIEHITAQLMYYGKREETPAAVIADGTMPEERMVCGTLSDIAKKVRAEVLSPPAVLVIGETARLHFKMESKSDAPVFGVTGTPDTNRKFSEGLKNCGDVKGAAVPFVEMQTFRLPTCKKLEQELERIAEYTWIFFTSKQAVDIFFDIFFSNGVDIRKLGQCHFAVIGSGTKQALLARGICADFMPKQADGRSFVEEFVRKFHGGKILFPHALQCHIWQYGTPQGNMELPDIFQTAGFEMNAIPVYDVSGQCGAQFEKAGEIENFVFFSASGVFAFFEQLEKQGIGLKQECRMYCIGDRTRQALEKFRKNAKTWEVITARTHTVEGLLDTIRERQGGYDDQ